LQDSVRDQLRDRVGDADEEAKGPAARSALEDVLEFATDVEYLVRVSEDDLTYFCHDEAAA
jgi:hypothetical protein